MAKDTPINLMPQLAGIITYDQAPGALPNGTRVKKTNSVEGDTHLDGELATIVGSRKRPKGVKIPGIDDYIYFVTWDDLPGQFVCAINDRRIEKL